MYVRLAFAVAAHLEPEILIVDEVLAVGDAAFQRKCLGKMEDVAERGARSSSSATTCRRFAACARGSSSWPKAASWTPVRRPASSILPQGPGRRRRLMTWQGDDRYGDDASSSRRAHPRTDGLPTPVVISSEPFRVQMDIDVGRVPEGLTSVSTWLSPTARSSSGATRPTRPQTSGRDLVGRNRLECLVQADLLNAGRYSVHPRISIDRVRWIVHCGGVSFEVHRDAGALLYALVHETRGDCARIPCGRADGRDLGRVRRVAIRPTARRLSVRRPTGPPSGLLPGVRWRSSPTWADVVVSPPDRRRRRGGRRSARSRRFGYTGSECPKPARLSYNGAPPAS